MLSTSPGQCQGAAQAGSDRERAYGVRVAGGRRLVSWPS